MLPDDVLEELVRRTPLRQYLIEAAWHDLCTESRLQLLSAVARSEDGCLPAWLSLLGLRDKARIVRYATAQRTHFSRAANQASASNAELLQAQSDEDGAFSTQEIVRIASSDPSKLVVAVAALSTAACAPMAGGTSQIERLIFSRTCDAGFFGNFVFWLSAAIDHGTSDDALGECVTEYLARNDVRPALAEIAGNNQVDISDDHCLNDAIALAWTVIKRAGPRVRTQLALVAPTRHGMFRISVEQLCEMPSDVLAVFPRRDDSEEIRAVLKIMREAPNRFPEPARAASAHCTDSAETAIQQVSGKASYNEQQLACGLADLERQVQGLQERLSQLTNATAERGVPYH